MSTEGTGKSEKAVLINSGVCMRRGVQGWGVRYCWIGVPRMGKNSLDMKLEAMWTQASDLIQGGVSLKHFLGLGWLRHKISWS